MIRLRFIIETKLHGPYESPDIVYRKRLFLYKSKVCIKYYNVYRSDKVYHYERSINIDVVFGSNLFKHRKNLSLKEKALFKFYKKLGPYAKN